MEPVRDPEGIEIEILREIGNLYSCSVLEIGCGNGRLIWRYADSVSSIVGIDPDIKKLAEAVTARPPALDTHIIFAQTQAEDLPFADERFETAIFGWSL
ncbi:MAG: class I SAM-dependent methyltransferase [Candidatus Promineifilaceae bacterium]|jgi:ubiquinone/menaquinone biosynthesis C-methylase UbiE